LLGSTTRPPPAAPGLSLFSARGARLDRRHAVVDSFEQLRLFGSGCHGQTYKFIGQANVSKDTARVVVKMEKRARFEVENSGALLLKNHAESQFFEER
jgi:hypothetical protein